MFKKFLFSLIFLFMFITDDVFAARPHRISGSRIHHPRPYSRSRRYYYGRSNSNYLPGIFTFVATAALLNAADKEKEVIIVKREFTNKELELQKRINELEKDLNKSKKQLKESQEKEQELPEDLKKKVEELERTSKELKESLKEQEK